MNKPLLAITMGDPAGVGAEIVVKAYDQLVTDGATVFVIGSAGCLKLAMQQTGCQHQLTIIETPEQVNASAGSIQVLEPVPFDVSGLVMGKVSSPAVKRLSGILKRQSPCVWITGFRAW